MKKLIYIIFAFISIGMQGQTANGTETKQQAFRSLNPQTVTSVNFLTSMGTDGTMGKINPINLPIPTLVQNALDLKANTTDLPDFGTKQDTKSLVTIAAWGDSLTAGSGLPESESYPANFSKITGYQYVNGGVGGETSTQIKDRMVAATATYTYPTIIWVGRNNYNSPATVKADIATMVATLGHDRYLVLGIINGDYATEYVGQSGYNTIVALNSDLAAIYGSRFVDIRTYLVSLYDTLLPQDVIDHANDVPPSSLRFDQLHLNNAGYSAVADKLLENVSILEGTDKKALDLRYAKDLFASPPYIGAVLKNRGGFTELEVTGNSLFTSASHMTNNLVVDGLLTASNSILNQPSLYIGSGLTSGWAYVNGTSSSILRGYSSGVLKTEINPNGNSYFNGGNLTIGHTDSLGQKLRVNGTGYFEGKLTAHEAGVSAIPFDIGGGVNAGWIFQNGGSPTSRSIMKGYFNTTQSIQLDPVTFTYFNMTNFAIGTTTNSGFKLDVNGSTRLGSTVTLGTIPATSGASPNILTSPAGGGNIEKLPYTTFAPNLLTGFSPASGVLAGTDTVLQGFNKLAGNQALKANLTDVNIQNITDAPDKDATIDTSSNITLFGGTADNRTISATTADASGNDYSTYEQSNSQARITNGISGGDTAALGAWNGLIYMSQTNAGVGTTEIGVENPVVSTTIKTPALSVAGTYTYEIQPKEYLVSALPTPIGSDTRFAIVTDALTPSYMVAIVGGGSVVCPVFYNGTNWVAH